MVTKWASLIERKVTMGNLATICIVLITWSISGAVWYTQVGTHIEDKQIHQNVEQKQAMMDARVHLLTDGHYLETDRRLTDIERALTENTKLLYEIKGRLPKEK